MGAWSARRIGFVPSSLRAILLALTAVLAVTHVAPAQWVNDHYRFGQNKVNYEAFDWHTIETEHFQVYFYQGEERIAQITAQMAEDAYSRISEVLDYTPSETIPIIVYDSHNDFEQSNATWGLIDESTLGFTEALKNRVVLPFTGSYTQFRHVVHHELVHAFMFDMFYRRGGTISVASQLWWGPPLWFAEGLAEYCSTDWTTEKNMWVRGAVIDGYLGLRGYQAYTAGYSLVRWIADEFGPEKVGAITRRMAIKRQPLNAFTAELGITLEELQERWERHLKRYYWPEIEKRELVDEFATQLTDHREEGNFLNMAPAIAPQGDRIAVLTDRDEYTSIYVMSAIDGRVLHKVVTGERSGHFEEMHWTRGTISWSPDGRQLVFAAKNRNLDVIYIVDAEDGDIVRELRFPQFNSLSSPDWSPDGHRIAFVAVREGKSDLYTVDLRSGAIRRLTNDLYDVVGPRWSPDGECIAFTSDLELSDGDTSLVPVGLDRNVFTIDTATGEVVQVTFEQGDDLSPAWSPDGRTIAFTSDRNGIYNLYVTERADDGTWRAAQPVTNVLNGVFTPHWSPTGRKITFSAFSMGGYDVYVMPDTLLSRDVANPLPPAEYVERRVAEYEADSSRFLQRPPLSGRSKWAFQRPELTGVSSLSDACERYRVHFSPDMVSGMLMANNIDGLILQTLLLISDTMGDHQIMIYAMIHRNIEDANFEVDYLNRERRINWGFSVYQYHQYYLRSLVASQWTSDRVYGVKLLVSRPFSRFTRVEAEMDLSGRERVTYLASYGERRFGNHIPVVKTLSPTLSLVNDNTRWGMTGPVNGSRSAVELKYAPQIAFNTYSHASLVADWRRYHRVGKDYTFATRIAAGASFGRNKERFLLGGTNYWINFHYTSSYDVLGDSLASITRFVTPIRSGNYGALAGTRFGLMNVEFRYPLVRELKLGWPIPLHFRNIRGILFVDAGTVWGDGRSFDPFDGVRLNTSYEPGSADPSRRRPTSQGGYGFGWRVNLGVFVLKWDIAWQTDLRETYGGARQFWSLGADF